MSQAILLIQDDAVAASAVIESLRNSVDIDFHIEWARSCAAGVELLTREGGDCHQFIDAVLAKLELPDSNGMATFDRLFRAAPRVPILVISAAEDEAVARLAEALRDENERAQVTLNFIGDVVISTDISGSVTYLNAVAERLTGWTAVARQDRGAGPSATRSAVLRMLCRGEEGDGSPARRPPVVVAHHLG